MQRGPRSLLLCTFNGRRLPCTLAHRQNGGRRFFRPVQTHHKVHGAAWRGKPVCLFVSCGSVFLNLKRQRSVGVFLQAWQHRGIYQVAIDRILDKQVAFAAIHRYRPKRVHWRKLPGRKSDRVIVFTGVDVSSAGHDSRNRVRGFDGGVTVDSTARRARALKPVSVTKRTIPEP
jgi:hypothetical protein